MRCPVCLDTDLVGHISDSIEVDRCPRCRGIWLDRGELEKLLDLAEARSPGPVITSRTRPEPEDRRPRDERDQRPGHGRRRRKGSFAEMLEGVFEALD